MQLRQAVKVPKKNLISEVKRGFNIPISTLNDNAYRSVFSQELPRGHYTVSHNTPLFIRVDSSSILTSPTYQNTKSFSFMHNGGKLHINLRLDDTSNLGDNFLDVNEMKIQLEQGTTATPFEPYQEINRKASRLKEWEYVRLDGSLNWVQNVSFSGYKQVAITNFFGANNGIGETAIAQKPNGVLIQHVSNSTQINTMHNNGGHLRISIPNSETGFTDAQNPTAQQWKDFFNANPYQLVYRLATPQHTPNWTEYPSVFKQYEPKPRGALVPKEWEYVRLDGSLGWVNNADYSGYKRVRVELALNVLDYAQHKLYKKNGNEVEAVQTSVPSGADKSFILGSNKSVYITISNMETGFTDAMTPTAQQWKDFFAQNPYQMVYKLAQPTMSAQTKYPTPFEQYSPKPRQTQPRWQPVYQLPFTFERLSTAIRSDGLLVGLSQPRLENNLVLVGKEYVEILTINNSILENPNNLGINNGTLTTFNGTLSVGFSFQRQSNGKWLVRVR